MSYDLNFWKYKKDVYLDNHQVYINACCEGKQIDGLEQISIEEVMNKLRSVFTQWQDGENCFSKDGH